jgi:phasin family protein
MAHGDRLALDDGRHDGSFQPEQWLSAESSGFEYFLGFTSQYFETLECLTALNLQAVRFSLAETQEIMVHTIAADNLPEILSLPALLVPTSAAQVLSYSRQFVDLASAMPLHVTSPHPGAVPRVAVPICSLQSRNAISTTGSGQFIGMPSANK